MGFSTTTGCLRLAILSGLLLATAGAVMAAEVLRYKDADGVVHYVDSIVRIPPAYRDQVESMETDGFNSTEPVREPPPASASNLDSLDGNPVVTRVRINGNRVLVPVTVSYRDRTEQLTLLLDTGASATLLDRDVARQLGVSDTEQVQGRVADGRTIRAERGTLDFLQVGPLQVRNLEAAFVDRRGRDPDYDGLLGMNFLRHFQYRIDFSAHAIHWSAP